MKIDSQKYIVNMIRDRIWVLKQSIERNKLLVERRGRGEASVTPRSTIADEREMKEAEESLKELGEICSKGEESVIDFKRWWR
jgi:hypothetical protein